jgi:hypothetical protein
LIVRTVGLTPAAYTVSTAVPASDELNVRVPFTYPLDGLKEPTPEIDCTKHGLLTVMVRVSPTNTFKDCVS